MLDRPDTSNVAAMDAAQLRAFAEWYEEAFDYYRLVEADFSDGRAVTSQLAKMAAQRRGRPLTGEDLEWVEEPQGVEQDHRWWEAELDGVPLASIFPDENGGGWWMSLDAIVRGKDDGGPLRAGDGHWATVEEAQAEVSELIVGRLGETPEPYTNWQPPGGQLSCR